MTMDDVVDEILGNDNIEKIGNDWTFAGVLIEFWDDVSKNWKEERTGRSYLADYKRFVLPYVTDRPLKDCDREVFDNLMTRLPELRSKEGLITGLPQIRHFKWIIKKVLEAAEKNGVCPDILWGTDYNFPVSASEERLNSDELVKLRKSLAVEEEINIARLILEDPLEEGQKIGLALMFGLGLRNSEACWVKFGDVKPFVCDNSMYYMLVYSSGAFGAGGERFSGKSENMPRLVPIPNKLLSLIFERRKFLYELIERGEFLVAGQAVTFDSCEQIDDYIDRLTIACVDSDYSAACSSAVLTRTAKNLLKKVEVDQELLSLIDREFRRPGRTEDGIKEKEPTAYLFRRNLGTHLYLLGLNDSEIQYVMGHDIEEEGERRNFFRNEEKLYPIAKKMSKRPILNENSQNKGKEILLDWFSDRNVCEEEVHIPITEGLKKIVISIDQCEPGSSLDLIVDGSRNGTYEQYPCEDPLNETLNITFEYQREYERKIKRMSLIVQE